MNIDLMRLKNGLDEYIDIDASYSFSESELENTNIMELNNVCVSGSIYKEFDDYEIELEIEGVMILPCSVSLKPVKYPFKIEIVDNINELLQNFDKKTTNTLDILPIVWENILMEIPLRIVSSDLSDVKVEGEGWRLISNEEETI